MPYSQFFFIGLICVFASCSTSNSDEANGSLQALGINSWNAGVVFYGRTTKVCFPVDDHRLKSTKQIAFITSSCSCVNAIAKDYVDSLGKNNVALLVEIFHEAGANDADVSSALGVDLHVGLTSNEMVERKVQFVFSPES